MLNEREGRRQQGLFVLGLALLVLAADQLTKHLVRGFLEEGESWHLLPSLGRIFSITHVRNRGAAFGLLPNADLLFVLVAVVVIVVILFYSRSLSAETLLVRVSLGLQLGGAAGNLVDRLFFQGYVTDFLAFNLWPSVFNVADSCIVVGMGILVYRLWRHPGGETLGEG